MLNDNKFRHKLCILPSYMLETQKIIIGFSNYYYFCAPIYSDLAYTSA